ncbi:hypothetical protein [Mycolicibacterium obuense]|uniref:Uncharacterized protein n=1 Tax=Mycolicibacterium obuense TaxID=1807 RepID=A0A0M2K738_9MYCO|nr:hypothetical protein [Mycolicibacterium obuense]KKF02808.1 hypothetical protein WN67_06130 [Mycolicibacterium obuense]
MPLMKSSVVVWSAVAFGAFAAFTAVVACVQFARLEVPSALVALGGSIFCLGFVIPAFKSVPGRVKPRVRSDSDGTTFLPDRGIEIPLQVGMAGALMSSVLVLILLPAGRLAIPVPPNMRYALPFTASFLVVGIVPMLWRNLRRSSMSRLRLTERGFEYLEGWRPQSADWSSVEDVTSQAPQPKKSPPSAIVVILSDDTVLSFTASSYTPGGVALRNLVQFYWRHPEARGELTDGRAAERLVASH